MRGAVGIDEADTQDGFGLAAAHEVHGIDTARGFELIGASDPISADPESDPQIPENMAATIYESLGLPRTITWKDALDRPHHVFHGDPIAGLRS